MRPTGTRRERGAYFTPEPLARAIAGWGVRALTEVVLDPAAGEGALLVAAHGRMREMGRPDGARLHAVELHEATHRRLTLAGDALSIPSANLRRGDFFHLSETLPSPDVILMNPPFVRHHDIPARAHERMRATVRELGAPIGGRASSWAYFLMQALRILKPGGRIAAVLPSDVLGASYAQQVLEFIDRSFGRAELSVQSDGLFEGLQLRVVLLFAEEFLGLRPSGAGKTGDDQGANDPAALVNLWRGPLSRTRIVGNGASSLLQDLRKSGAVQPLRNLASIGIGYVAGDSAFLHLTDGERQALGIRVREVVGVIARARALGGLSFNSEDWEQLRAAGSACWLFRPGERRSQRAIAYLKGAKAKRARKSAKCIARDPWWNVDIGAKPEAFVVYMGELPRLVANSAQVWASNALYVARGKLGRTGAELALASMTSVARIGMSLTGRQLGGGLRKLDVKDVQELLVSDFRFASATTHRVDALIRKGSISKAIDLADEIVLRDGLGWSRTEIRRLQTARQDLS